VNKDGYGAKMIEIEPCDGVYSYFVYMLCHLKKNGLSELSLPQSQMSSCLKSVEFAKLCVALIIDGTTYSYYDFLIDFEYQKILRAEDDEKLFTELYVIKNLASLLRAREVREIHYLVQSHCGVDVRDSLLSDIENTFGRDLVW